MNTKKIVIAFSVIVIVLVAIIALVLKYQMKSGTPAVNGNKISNQASVDGSSAQPESDIGSFGITKNADGQYVDTAGNIREIDTSINSNIPAFLPLPVESIQISGPALNAMPGSADAPKQAVVKDNDIPSQAVKIEMTANGFSPSEFRVKVGSEVTLALSASDGQTHVFIFPNASLMGLTTMVLGGSTKTITFNAPKAGVYPFRDDIPSFNMNTGVMIVE